MEWLHRRFWVGAARVGLILSVVLAVAAGSVAAAPGSSAAVSTAGERALGAPVVLIADPEASRHRTPPPASAVSAVRVQSATINVNYLPSGSTDPHGQSCHTWPTAARGAFSYAAGIWEILVNSSVPIEIDACWADLGGGYLGYAITRFGRDFPGAPVPNTWYPMALANAVYGSDLDPLWPDMHLTYNRGLGSAWYFGTDGSTPSTQYDFASVVLHEITHGLGFAGSMKVEHGWGSWGGVTGCPFSYDRFTQDGGGNSLINTTIYPNPSSALGSALTSNNVWFDGPRARSANGGTRVKLYAPSTWQPGSSYSHLDQIFNGTENALMTYSLSSGESNHSPGPVGLGVLEDVGWATGDPAPAPTVTSIAPDEGENTGSVAVSVAGSGFQSGATLRLRRAGQADIVATGVTVSAAEISGTLDLTGRATGSWNVVVTNPDAQSGTLPGGFTVTAPAPTEQGFQIFLPLLLG